jgi:hypothetical protein
MRCVDIALLPLLRASSQQDDNGVAVPAEINPVAGTEVDAIFQNAFANAFDIGEIALLHSSQRTSDLGGSSSVQLRKPFGKRLLAVRGDIVADLKHWH